MGLMLTPPTRHAIKGRNLLISDVEKTDQFLIPTWWRIAMDIYGLHENHQKPPVMYIGHDLQFHSSRLSGEVDVFWRVDVDVPLEPGALRKTSF